MGPAEVTEKAGPDLNLPRALVEKGVLAKFPHSIDIPCQGLLSAVDRWLINLSFYISHRIM